MLVRELDNGEIIFPYSTQDLRRDFPLTSFVSEDYSSVKVYRVYPEETPAFNADVEKIEQGLPYKAGGIYKLPWYIVPLSEAEILEIQTFKVEQLKSQIISDLQDRLDAFALTRIYDNVTSASKYKDFTEEELSALPEDEQAYIRKFRMEARYLSLVTARTWARLYIMLDEVNRGERPVPTGLEDLLEDLPELKWPI